MITYLASPYSSHCSVERDMRFAAACVAAGKLMVRGEHVFSPIAHTHPIAMRCKLPTGFDYWQAYDEAMLRCCGRLVVLKLSGWKKSVGVAEEIRLARKLGIKISYMNFPAREAGQTKP